MLTSTTARTFLGARCPRSSSGTLTTTFVPTSTARSLELEREKPFFELVVPDQILCLLTQCWVDSWSPNSRSFPLTLNPLTWKIWWAPNNASRWQMGFNLAFIGLTATTRLSHHMPHATTRCGCLKTVTTRNFGLWRFLKRHDALQSFFPINERFWSLSSTHTLVVPTVIT